MQKDKALRLRDAGDARIEINEALAAPAAEPRVDGVTQPLAGWRRAAVLSLTAVGLLVLGGATAWYLKPSSQPSAQSPAHFIVSLPPGDQLTPTSLPIDVSADGTELAYTAVKGGVRRLYVRAFDNPDAESIPGTEGASIPFFSPDGRWFGFFAQGKLKKVSIGGGAPVTLCDVGLGGGASWGADDTIVFSSARDSGLWRIPATLFDCGFRYFQQLHRREL